MTRPQVSPTLIDNTPLRAAFERSAMTANDVARRLDWYKRGGRADTWRVQRTLGLAPEHYKGRAYRRQRINIDTAERIADIIGVGAWEIGI